MRRPTVHIIGAGVAGLAAAVKLSSAPASIVVHEGARQAGGRCRSFFDETINATIDNGNHLLLSGNRSALAYLDAIGARKELKGPDRCEIDFADMATNERWTLRPNEGLLPWWIFVEGRRTPGVKVAEYFGAARLLWAARNARFSDAVSCSGRLYERLWRPFFLAALNTDPKDGSAALALTLLRETFARGGRACHPLVAAHGLSRAFVDPALRLLQKRGAQIRFERRLRGIEFTGDRAASLDFEHDSVAVEEGDVVILATPSHIAASLVPDLSTPQKTNAILNGHFHIAPPKGTPPIIGVVNGTVEWIFAYSDRLSITISDAERFMDTPREKLAADLWRDVAALTNLPDALPSWRVIKEKRATFAATPEENARRPATATRWRNFLLAGDYVNTGLPATIEGAIRSGDTAAALALGQIEAR
ncbi:MAG TPA: hydroxysqualene dehydroxylase HpnE [Roseiarcus sp.]|nr:hydroxysqualene dehydroxylase HpnE [Roseiarcus sp.]